MTPVSAAPEPLPEAYAIPRRLELILGGQVIPVMSKPGLPGWQGISAATALLAEHANFAPACRVLLLGSGHGALAVILAQRLHGGELWIMDNSAVALEMTGATLQVNQVPNAHPTWEIDLADSQVGAFDAVAIELPKGRKLSRRWLALAWYALRPGGDLYLAGANELGIQSTIQDAASLFGPGAILGYKKGNRLARFTRPPTSPQPPGWLHENGVAPGTWFEFTAPTPVGDLLLSSLPGVFSYHRLDDASRLLLQHIQISPADTILDLGCGCGILGLVAAKMGAAQVDLVDSNLLAVAAASQNIRRLGLPNARALPSDVLSAVADRTYTRIITNPPFHAGKGVDYQVAAAFFHQSWAALQPGGEFLLVANRFIRYEKLIESLFRQTNIIAQDNRYRVLSALR